MVTSRILLPKGMCSGEIDLVIKQTRVDLLNARLVLMGFTVLLEMRGSPWA
jgi:hypothetical protein